MLKGISPLLSPSLLETLASMGHGDSIVIGDCNYPAFSTGKRCINANGVRATDLLAAIMQILPLDIDVNNPPVILMGSKEHPEMVPEIWGTFKEIVTKYEPKATFAVADRFSFYDKAKASFACIQTTEEAYFGCVILRKGVWFSSMEHKQQH